MIPRQKKTNMSTPDQMNKRNQKYVLKPDSNLKKDIILSCYLNQTVSTELNISYDTLIFKYLSSPSILMFLGVKN